VKTSPTQPLLLALAALFVAGIWALVPAIAPKGTGGGVVVGSYATSLADRTESQVRNARLAARTINGVRIAPGEVFSFNAHVQGWSQDEGYVKAPVSYGGELVRDYGGGVCQTSTTLYNAALLAGLPILERHAHTFHPAYVPPGRDAAVAYPGVDLRFKNNLAWPLTIKTRTEGEVLRVELVGSEPNPLAVSISERVVDVTTPARLTRDLPPSEGRIRHKYLRSPGLSGCRAIVWRTFWSGGREVRRETLSDDSYTAMDRIVALLE